MSKIVTLLPMDSAPRDRTGILVLLESESLGRVWHTAAIHPKVSFVGHQFAFDCPKMLGWLPLPTVVDVDSLQCDISGMEQVTEIPE